MLVTKNQPDLSMKHWCLLALTAVIDQQITIITDYYQLYGTMYKRQSGEERKEKKWK